MKNSSENKIINYDKFNNWDYATITIYFLVTIIVLFTSFYEYDSWRINIYMYAFSTPLFLYILNYKSLRKIYVYLIWLIFSLLHLWIYFKLKEKYNSDTEIVYYTQRLCYTSVFLLYFQIARVIHIKIKNIELVAPSWGGSYDIYDMRKIKFLDYIFFVIFMVTWLFCFPHTT